MRAAVSRLIKRHGTVAVAAGGVLMGVAALVMLGRYAASPADFGRRHVLILAVNAAAAAVLLGLIIVNLFRLVRAYRQRALGARLRARLVAMFVGLTLAPLLVVYLFSLQFVYGGIDSWFDSDLEQELSSALRLSRESLEVQSTSRLLQTSALAAALGNLDGEALSRALSVLRADAGAEELTVFTPDLRVATSSSRTDTLPPSLSEDALNELRQSQRFVALEPQGRARYQVRTAVVMPGDVPEAGQRYLQAVFPIGDRQGRLADAVQDTYTRYAELRFLRGPLKDNLTVTLSLVLLLSLLSAATGAFYLAQRLAAPIESLAAGTEAVARGDFDTRLPPGPADEVGFLIESFNGMIGRLDRAREESRISQQQLERERANLATILGRLSTGVIAIGPNSRIRIANDAAGAILGVDLASRAGASLEDIEAAGSVPAQFVDACRPHVAGEQREWRGQIVLRTEGARRILNCATSVLPGAADPGADGESVGAIIVFDDVTELLVAQREAAWGEVARRLAHEIKNPLTPIRLAAERIRRRYLPTMTEEDGQVLDRSTHTIVQQVEAMRDMVNAFSEYARAPAITIARVDLSQLVREVAWLYRAQEGQPLVNLVLEDGLEVEADAVRVRQLLHNLIRNAQEALEGQTDGVIGIGAHSLAGGERPFAEISVTDNGPGIDVEVLASLFEPYVTSKRKGTGLGLAIVKKLVEEHGGTVAAENPPEGGARLVVRLPVRAVLRDAVNEPRGTQAEQWRERA